MIDRCGDCGHGLNHHIGGPCLGSDGCTCTFFRQHTTVDEDPNEVELRRAQQALRILDMLETSQSDFTVFSPRESTGPWSRWHARLAPGDGFISGESLADCLAQLAQSLVS